MRELHSLVELIISTKLVFGKRVVDIECIEAGPWKACHVADLKSDVRNPERRREGSSDLHECSPMLDTRESYVGRVRGGDHAKLPRTTPHVQHAPSPQTREDPGCSSSDIDRRPIHG
jgi:hypothetical protein